MDLLDRIKMVIQMNNLTPSSFADQIGVQRSSVSHILSGRNKPSLDFIQKTLATFPKVSSEWLVKGNQPDDHKETSIPFKEIKAEKKLEETTTNEKTGKQNSITKIVVFYDDGTFEEFKGK